MSCYYRLIVEKIQIKLYLIDFIIKLILQKYLHNHDLRLPINPATCSFFQQSCYIQHDYTRCTHVIMVNSCSNRKELKTSL